MAVLDGMTLRQAIEYGMKNLDLNGQTEEELVQSLSEKCLVLPSFPPDEIRSALRNMEDEGILKSKKVLVWVGTPN